MKEITISDVARMANVSPSSVSNVLNGRSKRMSSSTRERVLNAIEQLGYTPNFAARQLKTGRSPYIGLIVPSVANPFYGMFARLVEDAALAGGYQVLLGNSDRDPERERHYAEELLGYGVRGIIFGSSLTQFTHLESLIDKGLHVVAFDRPTQQGDRIMIDSIGVDNVQATRLATRHLLALGHRRIGFISGPIRTVNRLDRLEGYRMTLEEAGIEVDPQLIWEGVTNDFGDGTAVKLGRHGAHDLLTRSDRPTAIITINDMYAFGIYAGTRDLGLNIPEDLSVVGMDDIALAEIVQPPLTTVRQPISDIARLAVERLIGRLQVNCKEPLGHQVLSPTLIVRGSTTNYSGS
ncbi:MAG: LacI family transcriptional regulator [Proteobacteria bacterium]|nr:LacI family transcriptional regulator [Pseudomonadota bacterium]